MNLIPGKLYKICDGMNFDHADHITKSGSILMFIKRIYSHFDVPVIYFLDSRGIVIRLWLYDEEVRLYFREIKI